MEILQEDEFEHLGIDQCLLKKLPQSVTLSQTVAVWKYIVFYVKKWNNNAN